MDKLIINNVSGDVLEILGHSIDDQDSYLVENGDLINFAKDAYLRVLCMYALCNITVYDLDLIQETAVMWLKDLADANVVYS